jgi:hypothetical protein
MSLAVDDRRGVEPFAAARHVQIDGAALRIRHWSLNQSAIGRVDERRDDKIADERQVRLERANERSEQNASTSKKSDRNSLSRRIKVE